MLRCSKKLEEELVGSACLIDLSITLCEIPLTHAKPAPVRRALDRGCPSETNLAAGKPFSTHRLRHARTSVEGVDGKAMGIVEGAVWRRSSFDTRGRSARWTGRKSRSRGRDRPAESGCVGSCSQWWH